MSQVTPINFDQSRQLLSDWCAKNNFEMYEHGSYLGISCENGDRRLYFYYDKENNVYPAFFSWLPHSSQQYPRQITLLPYPGNCMHVFISKLERSMRLAAEGIDHLDRLYDKEEIWRLAQSK
ncbi:hypothetical protein [Methylomonas sp. AM2-LC]|uniref:hypothetical protein n=1 Tax=Methylomonas sp. AM2-LC TaxID=3153301 RepID=UPI003264B268